MKGSCARVRLLVMMMMIIVLLGPAESSRHLPRRPAKGHGHGHHRSSQTKTGYDGFANFRQDASRPPSVMGRGKFDMVQIAGSKLPDCSHACGSCSPCRLVMVSFVCSSPQEAETCPMAYKCMCHNKSYPVP